MMTAELLPDRIEAPQLYYPKGPSRKIESFALGDDRIAGSVVVVKLSCGHEATLCGPWPFDPNEVLVRCAYCLFDRRSGLTGADGGRRT